MYADCANARSFPIGSEAYANQEADLDKESTNPVNVPARNTSGK